MQEGYSNSTKEKSKANLLLERMVQMSHSTLH